jgi:hypothetical protein
MMRFSVPPTRIRGAALAGLMLGALIAAAPVRAQERFGPLVLANAQATHPGPATAARSGDKRRVDTAPARQQRRIGAADSARETTLNKAQFVVMPWSVGVYR